jgi:PQQ enzyme repeat
MPGNRHDPRRIAPRWRWAIPVCLALLAVATPARTSEPASPEPAEIATYHADPAHDGRFSAPGLTWDTVSRMRRDTRFDAEVPGAVYAQPLFWTPPGGGPGRVIVATEHNVVTALDAVTGRTIWRTTLGPPAPAEELRCGNIDPLGITGTPVIDVKAGAIYLDAVIQGPTGPNHELFGLRLSDGAVLAGWPIDVHAAMAARGQAFVARDQNQRAALAMLDGRVFVGYGGHTGDCGQYHGVVLAVATAPPRLAADWITRGRKGGIWSPGGITVADGHVFFTTGNTDRPLGEHGWDDGMGAFRETPALTHGDDPHDFFAPADYARLDSEDLDLGGSMPLPVDLADGARRLVALGKDGRAYLLDRDNLGGIGGALEARRVANGPIITAPVTYRLGATTIVAFRAPGGICPDRQSTTAVVALTVTDRAMRPVWCAPLDGRGIPIVTVAEGGADPIVWIMGAEGDDRLHGYRGDTGRPVYTAPEALPGMRHFMTLMVAAGRLYLAGDGHVFAYRWD